MTNLTEQWKKGKLPCGWYWCKCYNEEIKKLYYDGDCFELDDPETKNYYFFSKEDVAEISILEKVPSYEDYISLKKFMVDGINAVNSIRELEKENAKLKEQLKECRDFFDECFSPSLKHGELYRKINEVLK